MNEGATALEVAAIVAESQAVALLDRVIGGAGDRLSLSDSVVDGLTRVSSQIPDVVLVDVALGVFFIGMIAVRRWLSGHSLRLRWTHLAAAGALVGFLTGIVASTGPITVPLFLGYGLVKGAFIATEAAASLAVYVAKALVFRSLGALPLAIIAKGLVTGASLMVGAFVARRYVTSMPAESFRLLMDAVLLLSGTALLWAALV